MFGCARGFATRPAFSLATLSARAPRRSSFARRSAATEATAAAAACSVCSRAMRVVQRAAQTFQELVHIVRPRSLFLPALICALNCGPAAQRMLASVSFVRAPDIKSSAILCKPSASESAYFATEPKGGSSAPVAAAAAYGRPCLVADANCAQSPAAAAATTLTLYRNRATQAHSFKRLERAHCIAAPSISRFKLLIVAIKARARIVLSRRSSN